MGVSFATTADGEVLKKPGKEAQSAADDSLRARLHGASPARSNPHRSPIA